MNIDEVKSEDQSQGEQKVNINVIYLEEEFCIQPPDCFDTLLEVSQDKFNTFRMAFSYVNDSNLTKIDGEKTYQGCIKYAKANNLSNLDIYLEGEDKPNRRRTSSFKKISKKALTDNKINMINTYEDQDYSNGCVNDEIDDYGKDYRNPKYNQEENGYTKHSHNFTDKTRVYYIKEKKAIFKEDQKIREKEKLEKLEKKMKEDKIMADGYEVNENFGKRKNKRKKRGDD